jgi:hypothetical protein
MRPRQYTATNLLSCRSAACDLAANDQKKICTDKASPAPGDESGAAQTSNDSVGSPT